MKLEMSVSSIPTLPEPTGPHELAWSYLLDAVFADAFHAGLGVLKFSLPSAALRDEVQLRGELSQRASSLNGASGWVGAALLGHERALPAEVKRAYVLQFGVLAPRALRGIKREELPGWQLEQQLSVYSFRTYLHGLPIRFGLVLKRPDLYDRAMFAMRRDFARKSWTPAYYHLSIWSQS